MMTRSDLSGGNFEDAELRGANLIDAAVIGANLVAISTAHRPSRAQISQMSFWTGRICPVPHSISEGSFWQGSTNCYGYRLEKRK
jgi:uncharacterized protein YjbI with pentapeptide repeats